MAEIKPFRALRFDTSVAGDISTLTCPPYDIISDEKRQEFLKSNPYNVVRLELPKGDNPYMEAGKTLEQWENTGVIKQDKRDALYIYEIEFEAYSKRKSIKGFICRVKLEEFSKGIILPHEETLSKAKTDRFNLMKTTNCNFSQIYSLYMDETRAVANLIDKLSSPKPDIETTDENGLIHRIWTVTDKADIDMICTQFLQKKLYIADGHHRYETALNYRNYLREKGKGSPACDYVMMMLVDMLHPGLVVFPTHRMVHSLENFSAERLLQGCSENFEIQNKKGTDNIEQELKKYYNEGKKAFCLYLSGDEWNLLVLKNKAVLENILPDSSKALRELDVTVLHTLILEKVLGIDKENMANQVNLSYTRSLAKAIDLVKSKKCQCSFILNPTKVTEIRDVAIAGEKMPQKSTYFYPKLITGLVMNKLCD